MNNEFNNEVEMNEGNDFPVEQGNYNVTLLLAYFLGFFGVHRFYNKKIGSGIAMLLTCGGLGIWALVDVLIIMTGNFTDQNGNKLRWKEDSFFKNVANVVVIVLFIVSIIMNVVRLRAML